MHSLKCWQPKTIFPPYLQHGKPFWCLWRLRPKPECKAHGLCQRNRTEAEKQEFTMVPFLLRFQLTFVSILQRKVSLSSSELQLFDCWPETGPLLKKKKWNGLRFQDWADHLCLSENDSSTLETRPLLLPLDTSGPNKNNTNSKAIRFILWMFLN